MDTPEQIIKTIASPINHQLKIVLKGDKKLLNTKNTNYSYGTLVKVLEYGLDNIPMTDISSVLLLGMGGGSIIYSLRKKYQCLAPVTAIEIDPIVIDIASDKFNVKENDTLKIHCIDAWEYIKKSTEKFDLIIIDIFIDTEVPEKFYQAAFWQDLEKNVEDNGFILFNAGIDLKEEEVSKFVSQLPQSFIYQKNHGVLESNTVIIIQKIF